MDHIGRILNVAFIVFVTMAAFIGVLFLTRGTAVRRVRGVGVDGAPTSPEDDAFPVAVSLLTGTTLLPGNEVELVLDGDVFPRLYDDLRNARTSITLQMYYAHSGQVTETLAEILAERARAGVRVYLLYDAFGAKALGGNFARRLRAAGAHVIPFRPLRFRNLWIIQNRAHVRAAVI